jgi:hypothetical protein
VCFCLVSNWGFLVAFSNFLAVQENEAARYDLLEKVGALCQRCVC